MKMIYIKALIDLQRRILTTKRRAKSENNMVDCGWTDRQHEAYSLMEHYKAVYKFEKIQRRLNRKAGA